MPTLKNIENPFISDAEKDRIEKIKKASEAYVKKYAYDKASARSCLVKLGTHDLHGNLTKNYTSKK